MYALKHGEIDIIALLSPDTIIGALTYLVLFILSASLLARGISIAIQEAMSRHEHLDRTTINFVRQLFVMLIWVIALILYAHLIPIFRAMGTALLAGASVASVVIGMAAQSTLGNLVAGLAITIYRPFRLGDTLLVSAPNGTEIGKVEAISLGYTTLRTGDKRLVVIPNSVVANQVTLNLMGNIALFPLKVQISIDRNSDINLACTRAVALATNALGKEAVGSCVLTRVDGAMAQLELRFRGNENESSATTRSKLLTSLVTSFSADTTGGQAQQPSFC